MKLTPTEWKILDVSAADNNDGLEWSHSDMTQVNLRTLKSLAKKNLIIFHEHPYTSYVRRTWKLTDEGRKLYQ